MPRRTPQQIAERLEARVRTERAKAELARLSALRQAAAGVRGSLAGFVPGSPAYRSAQATRIGGAAGPRGGSANRHLSPAVRQNLRAYSQHLYRNSAIYRTVIDRRVQAVGGPWTLQAQSDDPKFNAAAEARFRRWAQREADAAGIRTLAEMLDTVERLSAVDGDAGVIMVRGGALQLFESEQLGGPAARSGLRPGQPEGLVLDADGMVTAYRFARYNEDGLIDAKGFDEVPAPFVLLHANLPRASQHRGEPLLAAAFSDIEQLEDYDEAVTVAAKTAAYVVLVRTMADPDLAAQLPGQTVDLPTGGSSVGPASGLQYQQDFELGTIFNMGEGDNVSQFKAEQPTAAYADFVRTKIRKLASLAGLPLEAVLLDFTQTNFHSAKSSQGLTEFILATARERRRRMLERIYRWRVGRWIASGELEYTGTADPLAVSWRPPPRPLMDPLKEAQAEKMRIEQNLDTSRNAIESRGGDWEAVYAQRGAERAREKELDIVPPSTTPQSNGLDASGALGTGQPGQGMDE